MKRPNLKNILTKLRRDEACLVSTKKVACHVSPKNIRAYFTEHPLLTTLDRYILKKFLLTYLLSIVLIIAICIVVDISEKMDSFFEYHAPLKAIIFDYYVNFIPYFTNMLTPLFVFISIIFFTSKMAYNTEITAILAGGVSFRRFMKPYYVGSILIVVICLVLSGYVIPHANITRLDFENQYVNPFKSEIVCNIQMEVTPGVILYIERFENSENRGYHAFLQKFDGKKLVSYTTCQEISWTPEDSVWHMKDWLTRSFDGPFENVDGGVELDTLIDVQPYEFFINEEYAPQMNNNELRHYIKRQNDRGMGNTQPFEIELHQRYASPLASLILMIIGVSLSSKKVKGGMGLQLGAGILLSACYILFQTISSVFAVNGGASPMLSAWIPNIIFAVIALVLYHFTPK